MAVSYELHKLVHLLGVILLVGNVTVTSVWKVFAERTREPATIAFAQRLVTGTDWVFTGGGIVLMIVGGYGMLLVAELPWFGLGWLLWSQLLFVLSGLIWLAVLLPIQVRQARMTRAFANGGEIPASYWRLARLWILWGVVATLPLLAATALMIWKVPR